LFDENFENLIAVLFLGGVLYFIYQESDFRAQRGLIEAGYPLVAVGLVCGLAEVLIPNFYELYKNYFNLT